VCPSCTEHRNNDDDDDDDDDDDAVDDEWQGGMSGSVPGSIAVLSQDIHNGRTTAFCVLLVNQLINNFLLLCLIVQLMTNGKVACLEASPAALQCCPEPAAKACSQQ
jgi:hypothetical protein